MLNKGAVKTLSLLLVSLILVGAMPALLPGAWALDETDLAEIIDGWNGGGVGSLSARITGENEITVTGAVSDVTEMLHLDIDLGMTVIWKAEYSNAEDGQAEYMCLISIGGDGTFEVGENGSIRCNAKDGYAINAFSSNGTIKVSGGIVSSTAGIAIYAPSESPASVSQKFISKYTKDPVTPSVLWDPWDLEDHPPNPGVGGGSSTGSNVILTGGTVGATTGIAIIAEYIHVNAGSKVTVSSAGCNPAIILENYGCISVDAGELTVNGDIEGGGFAISAENGAFVTVNGSIYDTQAYGVEASNNSIVSINGSIESDKDGGGVYAYLGAEVIIAGNISVVHYGVWAHDGASVTVNGNVSIGEYAQAVVAGGVGTSVTINGDVSAGENSDGVRAGVGAVSIVNGNVNAGNRGAFADNGGKVIVNGTIDANIYIYLYDDAKISDKATLLGINDDIPSTKPGYREYTDGKNTVWVMDDTQKVAETIAWLTWDVIKGNNISQDCVTDDLYLPVTGKLGTTIIWESSDPLINTESTIGFGMVLRPPSGAANKPVTLTASISSGDVSNKVEFNLILLAYPPEHAQNAEADLAWLTWDLIRKDNLVQTEVTSGLNLPITGANSSVIEWRYPISEVAFPIDLATGVVTRPTSGSGNATVQIAAVIIYESALRIKYFDLVVLEESSGGDLSSGSKDGGNTLPESAEVLEPDPAIPLTEDWDNLFDDVVETDWFYEAVQFVAEGGLMEGTDDRKFSPNVIMSRAMLVTVLYRLDGKPDANGEIPFSDVKSGEWYSNAILWANANEIVIGYNNDTFGLNDPVTREQAVTILYRYAKSKDIEVSSSTDLSQYTDVEDISDWALVAMKWAVAEGIIQGRTLTTTAPQGTSTRAELAMIFKRFISGSV